jgi:hypothetical protein
MAWSGGDLVQTIAGQGIERFVVLVRVRNLLRFRRYAVQVWSVDPTFYVTETSVRANNKERVGRLRTS